MGGCAVGFPRDRVVWAPLIRVVGTVVGNGAERSAERSVTPWWLWPGVGGVAGFACALLSVPVRLDRRHPRAWLGWPGLRHGLPPLARVAAGPGQFSPRPQREFTRDG